MLRLLRSPGTLEKTVEVKADRLKSVTQEKHRLKPVLRGLPFFYPQTRKSDGHNLSKGGWHP
jgi:hypothetical protein